MAGEGDGSIALAHSPRFRLRLLQGDCAPRIDADAIAINDDDLLARCFVTRALDLWR
jgi:hypothetical protein